MSNPFPPSPQYPPSPPGRPAAPSWETPAPAWQPPTYRSEPPEAPPQPPEHSAGRVFAIVGAVAVFIAGVGLVLWVTFGRDGGPSHPDDWDPRVADIAQFVQTERGVLFDHAVYVDFLPDEEFTADVTASEDELTDEDRESIEQAESLLRALGLVEGDVDLFEDQNQLVGEGVIAYYDPDDERIRVRGTELTPDVRVTLAHELTHALQDQLVDLEEVRENLEEGANDRFRAVVEGDATNVADAYAEEELSTAEREEYERSSADEEEEVDIEDVPAALVAYFQAPYVFGPAFVRIVEQENGVVGLNDLLREPLASDLQLLDPTAYFDGDEPEDVALPEMPEGAELIEEGEFGALDWYVVLASRVDPKQALDAVDGWAGDSYTSYEKDERVCLEARYRAVDRAAADGMATLLDDWIASMGSDAASVSRVDDRTLAVVSCDPGEDLQTGESAPVGSLLGAPASRLVITADLMEGLGLDVDPAWCVAEGLVDTLTPEQLRSSTLDPAAQQAVATTMMGCGARPG